MQTLDNEIVLNGKTYVEKKTEDAQESKVTKTYVNVILDMSGSMSAVQKSTIAGYNEYIMSLQSTKDDEVYYVTLTLFDTSDIKILYEDVNVKDVKKLTTDDYRPNAGTPLYDAVCKTLNAAKNRDVDSKQLAVIITDGEENSSTEFDEKDMMRLKEKLEATGHWTFVYLGADQDAWAVAQKWGFAKGNTASYNNTDLGTRHTFMAMSASTQNFTRSAGTTTDSYFSDDQQQKMKDTK